MFGIVERGYGVTRPLPRICAGISSRARSAMSVRTASSSALGEGPPAGRGYGYADGTAEVLGGVEQAGRDYRVAFGDVS